MRRTSPIRRAWPALVLLGSLGLATVARAVLPSPAPVLVSADVPGTGSGNQRSSLTDRVDIPRRVVSQDGRYVVFISQATNLVPLPDANNNPDVFVRDLLTGTTQLVSVNQSGTAAANGFSNDCTISADGRYVCFDSSASDLAPGDSNGGLDVFVRDLQTRVTTLVSANPAGNSQSGFSRNATMTPDGHFVAFTSTAPDLVAGYQSAGGARALFLRDLRAPPNTATQLVSTLTGGTTLGVEVTDDPPDLSADGRFVVFTCNDFLVPADQNGTQDVYVRDTQLRVTELVSTNAAGTGSGNSGSSAPAISADGRYVAFNSFGTDLVAGMADTNNGSDVFLRDRTSRATKLVSVNAAGTAAGNGFTFQSTPSISTDGRYVAFASRATDLTPGVSGTQLNAYVRDTVAGSTALASVNQAGTGAGNGSTSPPTLSSDGRYVVFASMASDLVGSDNNSRTDVFWRDLFAGKTALVSRNAAGTDGGSGASGANGRATLSGDGAVVVFLSQATNLTTNDTNGPVEDVFAESPGVAGVPPPALSNCKTIPTTLPSSGGAVTISVDAVSSINLSFVSATITPPNAAAVSVTLPHSFSNTYRGTYNAPGNSTGDPQVYQVSVTAEDVQGQRSTMTCDPFTVAPPSVGPAITGCTLSPDPVPAAGGVLNITVSVTAGAGLRSVTATPQMDNHDLPQVTLLHTSGDIYRGAANIPLNPATVARALLVFLHATDNNGITVFTTCVGTQVGFAPPVITHCTAVPNPVPPGGANVTVSAQVTAGAGVRSVTVTVVFITSSLPPVPISHASGDTYRGVVKIPPNTRAVARAVVLSILATDKNGHDTGVNCTIQQSAFAPPAITDCTTVPNPVPAGGGNVTVSAQVTAGAGVSSVTVTPVVDGVTLPKVTLARASGATYRGVVKIPPNTAAFARALLLFVHATDANGNYVEVDCDVTQVATAPPKVTSCQLSPYPVTSIGGALTITATVEAVAGVLSFEASPSVEGQTLTPVFMKSAGGGVYRGSADIPANPGAKDRPIIVSLFLRDKFFRLQRGECSVTQSGVPPPVISNCKITPRILPSSGGTLSVSANITPLTGITGAIARITIGNTEYPAVTLTRTGIAPYRGTVKIGANPSAGPRQIIITIGASDTLGRVASGDCPSVRQLGSAPPVH